MQIVHCLLDGGARETMKWFGFALLCAVSRELLIENTAPVHVMPVGLALPQFIPVAMRWTFAIYVGEARIQKREGGPHYARFGDCGVRALEARFRHSQPRLLNEQLTG
jgi:hypothetical protein